MLRFTLMLIEMIIVGSELECLAVKLRVDNFRYDCCFSSQAAAYAYQHSLISLYTSQFIPSLKEIISILLPTSNMHS